MKLIFSRERIQKSENVINFLPLDGPGIMNKLNFSLSILFRLKSVMLILSVYCEFVNSR